MKDPFDYEYNAAFTPVIKTDGKRPITDEIASAATDVDMFQGWLPVMENTDKVLNLEGGGDISIYDDIGRDPRIAANLRTRAKAVVGREWQMIPFSQEDIDIKIAEYVKQVFLNFPYDLARRPILRGGVLKGYAVGEVMWDYSEGDTFIRAIRYRHQRRFRFAPNGDLHLRSLANPYPGVNASINPETGLPLRKFQVVTFGDEVTTPYGNGLGQELFWPWWFKKNGIKYWLMFVEKFAAPTAAGEYDDGAGPDQQQKLLSAAAALHSNSAIIYPKGMNLKLIEAARGGNISSYNELCEFLNNEMTICILGQLATTSGTPGKLGNSQEQEAVYLDYIKDDADSLCEAQNDRRCGVIPWLVDYQFPGHGRYPKVWIKTEDEEDGKTLAERDKALSEAMKNSGLNLSRAYFIRSHSLEEDDIEQAAPPDDKGTTPPQPGGNGNAGDNGDVSFADADPFPGEPEINALVAAITPGEMQQVMQGILKPVFDYVAQAGDLPGAMAKLMDIWPDMDGDQLQELLARIIFISEVWGRLQADE